jgi:alanine-alpha-ketoisovalerate/valine-pyruvate aminotransferase
MKSQFNRLDMENALEDRVGEFSGIRQVMRERLNKQGDRVMLRTEEVLYILDSMDYFKDTIHELQQRERELEQKLEAETVDG